MMNRCDLDERQLWIRGDVYKHCFVIMTVLLMLDAFLKDSGVNWANTFHTDILIIIVTVVAGMIEMICGDVYPKRMKFFFVLIGIFSIVIMIYTIVNLMFRGRTLILHNQLTDEGFSFAQGICWFVLAAVFVVKKVIDKRVEKEE